MPFVNTAGQVIDEIHDDASTAKAVQLSKWSWPFHREMLWHLTWSDFKIWLYLMSPRDAMLLSNDPDFVAFRESKRKKSLLLRFESWVWRTLWV